MTNKKGDAGIVAGLIIIAFIIFSFLVGLIFYNNLIWKTTENGHHTGTVTAVETNGLIFKTDSVYFKSDAQSSQEDKYCVYDKKIKEKLEDYARDKEKVTIEYEDYFIVGWKYCKDDDVSIITGVTK